MYHFVERVEKYFYLAASVHFKRNTGFDSIQPAWTQTSCVKEYIRAFFITAFFLVCISQLPPIHTYVNISWPNRTHHESVLYAVKLTLISLTVLIWILISYNFLRRRAKGNQAGTEPEWKPKHHIQEEQCTTAIAFVTTWITRSEKENC